MSKFLLVPILFLAGLDLQASTKLPVVSVQEFSQGRTWTWDYRKPDGSLYSSETYEVVELKGSLVRLSMSTVYADHSQIRGHHLIEADVNKCLEAYKSPHARKGWSLRLLYWDQNKWMDSGATQTLAFEEKFNCNPHPERTAEQLDAVFKDIDDKKAFQIPRKGKTEHSWFFLEGDQKGIQAEKEFMERGRVFFRSKLREPSLLFTAGV